MRAPPALKPPIVGLRPSRRSPRCRCHPHRCAARPRHRCHPHPASTVHCEVARVHPLRVQYSALHFRQSTTVHQTQVCLIGFLILCILQDCELLNLGDRPEKLNITEIAVPLVPIRLSVFTHNGKSFVFGSLETYVCFDIATCHCNATNALLPTAMKTVSRSY